MKIKPHKGGRTRHLPQGRITEAEEKMIKDKIKLSGLNQTDATIEAFKKWNPKD